MWIIVQKSTSKFESLNHNNLNILYKYLFCVERVHLTTNTFVFNLLTNLNILYKNFSM